MIRAGARFQRAFILPSAMLLCTILLTACNQSDNGNNAAENGQVAARIGADTITVQELNNEFRANNIPVDKQNDPEILKKIMGELVLRKYLAQQAVKEKLDREPGVLLDIIRSKEQVLASAALSREVTAKVEGLTKQDIDKYIASNPQKFADRQIITADEITFPLGTAVQTILESVQGLKTLDEIDRKMTSMNIPHNRTTGSLSSADLPEETAMQVQSRRPDDVIFFRSGTNGIFMTVKNQTAQPLTGEAAVAYARQSMRNDILRSALGMTSVAANLQAKYVGKYAEQLGGGIGISELKK